MLCGTKKCYKSENEAKKIIKHGINWRKIKLRVYFHKQCKMWHMTSEIFDKMKKNQKMVSKEPVNFENE